MVQSFYAANIELLAREYHDALTQLKQSPLYTATGDGVVYKPNSGGIALAERYEAARQNLAAVGICLESVLCAQPSSICSGATTGFERLDIRLMPLTQSWTQGYYALRDACVSDVLAGRAVAQPVFSEGSLYSYRPLTLGENLRARIVDARAHNNNIIEAPSWICLNDSCTAIIYGSDGKFKVQKISRDLLDLAPDFRQSFVQGRYDAVGTDNVNAMEFERRGVKYDVGLTQEEVLRHPFWRFVADGNASTLQEYTQLQWAGKPAGYKGMGVWLRDSPQNGELRALCVNFHFNYSSTYGGNLSNDGSFLRVAPREVR